MAQKLGHIQTQTQQQSLSQVLSPQQLLQVKILELPITELEERVKAEMDENPALTQDFDADEDVAPDFDDTATVNDADQGDFEEREERQDALDDALRSIVQDDDFDFSPRGSHNDSETPFFSFGETKSFYDELTEQIFEYNLTEKQTEIINYLIGTLDSDGYLRSSVDVICEELAIYHNLDASNEEIEDVIAILQRFDPAGIGARDLQECLLLQIERKAEDENVPVGGQKIIALMKEVISDHFREFTLKHWQEIQKDMQMSQSEAETVFAELKHLNPRPGQAMGEALNKSTEQITPDFIAETHDDGAVSFWLNGGNMPELMVEPSFEELLRGAASAGQASKSAKEAQIYVKTKVTDAKNFITALQMRRQTMYKVMNVIVEKQHTFFEDGDETSLKPMILKDIADKTGLDISTVSRVCSSKYVQTRWGTLPLKFFFTDGYRKKDGEEISVVAVKQMLKEIIESENRKKPYSDDVLAKKLKEKGYPIARRTVAKYREQFGIPVARLRK